MALVLTPKHWGSIRIADSVFTQPISLSVGEVATVRSIRIVNTDAAPHTVDAHHLPFVFSSPGGDNQFLVAKEVPANDELLLTGLWVLDEQGALMFKADAPDVLSIFLDGSLGVPEA